jgi:hypothetical protein
VHEATASAFGFHASQEFHDGAEGICAHDEVTPARDESRRATDASRLTFPLQTVLLIVTGILGTTGAFWVATSQLRSDIAVIRQVQMDQVKIDDMKVKVDEANRQLIQQSIAAVESRLNAVIGQVQLANIEIGNVRREMNERGVKK